MRILFIKLYRMLVSKALVDAKGKLVKNYFDCISTPNLLCTD